MMLVTGISANVTSVLLGLLPAASMSVNSNCQVWISVTSTLVLALYDLPEMPAVPLKRPPKLYNASTELWQCCLNVQSLTNTDQQCGTPAAEQKHNFIGCLQLQPAHHVLQY
jgi:hypothetical protein